jgi:hypothetical protein
VRVLLDENPPADLAGEFTGHTVQTVGQMGWVGIKNGELLRRMQNQFEALLTMDANLQYQQNLSALSFGVILLRAPSNRMTHLSALVPAVLMALGVLGPGEHRTVGA